MDDFERELERRLRDIPLPEDSDGRRERAVARAMNQRARTRARRRTATVAVAALLTICAAAFAVHSFQEEGRQWLGGGDDAPKARAESPYLQGLPWLWQPDGGRVVTDAPSGTVSLAFPVGVTYEEAVERLYTTITEEGTLPTEAKVVEPLPEGVVTREEADGALRLSLAAPFGYEPENGRVRTPSLSLPSNVPREEAVRLIEAIKDGPLGEALPSGVTLEIAPLPECQTERVGESRPPACPFIASGGS